MRIAIATLLLLALSSTSANASGHDLCTAWMRYFGYHNGPGYHAPRLGECNDCLPQNVEWESPAPSAPMPEIASPYFPAPAVRALPEPVSRLQLEREAHRGPHYFPLTK